MQARQVRILEKMESRTLKGRRKAKTKERTGQMINGTCQGAHTFPGGSRENKIAIKKGIGATACWLNRTVHPFIHTCAGEVPSKEESMFFPFGYICLLADDEEA
jgi:hypothetical protein